MDLKETLRLHKLWLKQNKDGIRADLRDADLRRAYLSDADLRRVHSKDVFSFKLCRWEIIYNAQDDKPLSIGCKKKTIKEWEKWFNGTEEYETPRNSNEFKVIKSAYKLALDKIKYEGYNQ